MKRCIFVLIVIVFSISGLYAQFRNTAHVDVFFSIPEINDIKINDSSLIFNLNYAGPGGPTYSPVRLNSTYNITTTGTNKKLLVKLDQNMPTNTYLDLRAEAPAGAASLGVVTLNAMQQILVENITNVNRPNLLLHFEMRADLGAPIANSQKRVVTLTISD